MIPIGKCKEKEKRICQINLAKAHKNVFWQNQAFRKTVCQISLANAGFRCRLARQLGRRFPFGKRGENEKGFCQTSLANALEKSLLAKQTENLDFGVFIWQNDLVCQIE